MLSQCQHLLYHDSDFVLRSGPAIRWVFLFGVQKGVPMFEKLTEHIYVRPHDDYTDRPNIGLVRGGEHSLLFDAGNSAAHVALLRQELRDAGLPQPDLVAVSHWHWDHTFGMHAWGAPVIAGRETDRHLQTIRQWSWDDASMRRRLESQEDIVFCSEMIKREYPDRSQIRVTTADIVFDGRLTVDLGGVVCELIHAKGPHAADSVICYVPSERFVFLGDSNGKDLYGQPWQFDLEHEGELGEILAALPYDRDLVAGYIRLLDALDFTSCIGGHAGPMTRQELYQSLSV